MVVVMCFFAQSSFLMSRHISWTIVSLCSAFVLISLTLYISSCNRTQSSTGNIKCFIHGITMSQRRH
ncbi:hypothetical protein Hanom_Chr03g00278781 [Helianthus anomalus]